jgi:hypothetical protein
MRPLVSLVEARPETVLDDYRRALALAGLDQPSVSGPWAVAACLDGARWQAGRTCPPWQISGVLKVLATGCDPLAPAGISVAAVGPGGLQPWPDAAPWPDLATGVTVCDASGVREAPVPVRSSARQTSLEATGAASTIPFALRHQPVLALAAADLVSPWRIEGACATLGRLILGGHPTRRGVPEPEIRADTVALLRELFPALGGVVDGTLWHVGPRGRVVARHVVIAGADPVAVDALTLRLAGYTPRDVPWLRLCAERELGAVDPAHMRLVGHTCLLDLDFALPEPTFARPVGQRLVERLAARLKLRRTSMATGGPWAALYDDMRAGRAIKADG